MTLGLDILTLDLATTTGWARGCAGAKPISGSVTLGRGGLGPGRLGAWLIAHRRDHGLPGLVVIEKWLPLEAQKNWRAAEVALRLNGASHAIIGGAYKIQIVEVAASTVRAAVCGRASAGDRAATKAMVVDTMKLLGLMPANSANDDDRADALALWRYAEAVYGRRAPAEFALTP